VIWFFLFWFDISFIFWTRRTE